MIQKVKRYIWRQLFRTGRVSYAQSGEDLLVDTIFNSKRTGFYVDIGANNPFVQSNTKFFYDRGWRGINIDALPGSMAAFRKARPYDINIEAAVGSQNAGLSYHMFENSLYNTFDGGKVADVQAASKYLGCKPIRARLLSEILEEHDVAQIDFFTIDVEGHEIEVLRSNNWIKFRPKIIIVEWFCRQRNVLETSPLHKFLESQNYVFFCNTATNAIYLEREFLSVRFPDYV